MFSSAVLLAVFSTSCLGLILVRGRLPDPPVAAERTPVAAGPLSAEEQRTIEVFQQASPSVVHITSVAVVEQIGFFRVRSREVEAGSGTGFVWDEQGHIVTNFHVVNPGLRRDTRRGDAVAWVSLSGSKQRYKGHLMGIAPEKDLALLRIDAEPELLQPLAVGSSANLQVGQRVLAIGNPFGLDQTLTTGVISALGREIESLSKAIISDVIQTDAAINPGNSGGPLLDSNGRLIGLNTAIYSPSGAYAGIGFSIPVDAIRRVIPDLVEFGEVRRPTLGIQTHDNINRYYRLPGVMVWRVEPRSGAAEAGLVPARERGSRLLFGDIIIAIDGKKTPNLETLESVLDDYRGGDTVTLTLIRNADSGEGERVEVSVRLSGR